jgi:hypothetical protein
VTTEHGRVLELKVDSELIEMGIRVTMHSPTARVICEFDVEDEPEVLWAILAISKAVVTHQMELMAQSLEEDTEEKTEVGRG